MGIKLFAFMHRLPGMAPEDFHAYWRDEHAARLARSPELAQYVRRFELNHRLAADYGREPHGAEASSGDYDGVAVLWFDSLDKMHALLDAAGRTEDDGPRFRRPDMASVVTGDEAVIVDTPRRLDAQAKLVCILRRNAALDLPTRQHRDDPAAAVAQASAGPEAAARALRMRALRLQVRRRRDQREGVR